MDEIKVVAPTPELIKGLAEVREKLKQPKPSAKADIPTKSGGKYSYSYTPLDKIFEAVDIATKDTGITYTQKTTNTATSVTVATVILHVDGGELDTGDVTLPWGGGPQNYGSAQTYARRYSLSLAFGIASDSDDDGQAAQRYGQQNQGYQNNRQNNNQRQGNHQGGQQRPQSQQVPQNANNARQQQPNDQQLPPSQQIAQAPDVQRFKAKVAQFAQSQSMASKDVMAILFKSSNVKINSWKTATVGDLFALNIEFNKLYGGDKQNQNGGQQQ